MDFSLAGEVLINSHAECCGNIADDTLHIYTPLLDLQAPTKRDICFNTVGKTFDVFG